MLQMVRVLRPIQHRLKPEMSKNSTICANEVKGSEQRGEPGRMARCWLHGMGPHDPVTPGGCYPSGRGGDAVKKSPVILSEAKNLLLSF
jgi:hypothetical protein